MIDILTCSLCGRPTEPGQAHPSMLCATRLKKDLDAARAEVERLKGVLVAIKELPCCPESKYPGCRACGAIDVIVHANIEKTLQSAQGEAKKDE